MTDGRLAHFPLPVRSADGPGRPGAPPVRVMDLTVLATTDLHGQILSYDYFANRPQFGAGLAQTASLIHAMRVIARNTLLLDNGDFFQGSALTELAVRSRNRRRNAGTRCGTRWARASNGRWRAPPPRFSASAGS